VVPDRWSGFSRGVRIIMGKREPSAIKITDITRATKAAIKGAKAAGMEVGRVVVDFEASKVVIIVGKPDESNATGVEPNDLDKWIANHAHAAKGH
jgi:hypothetical protein